MWVKGQLQVKRQLWVGEGVSTGERVIIDENAIEGVDEEIDMKQKI